MRYPVTAAMESTERAHPLPKTAAKGQTQLKTQKRLQTYRARSTTTRQFGEILSKSDSPRKTTIFSEHDRSRENKSAVRHRGGCSFSGHNFQDSHAAPIARCGVMTKNSQTTNEITAPIVISR